MEGEQAIINYEDNQETNEQHPVSSKQQVDKLLIVSNKIDDADRLNFDVKDVTTIIQSIDDELLFEHSSSTSCKNDVILDRASYPDTLEKCIQIIDELRHEKKTPFNYR